MAGGQQSHLSVSPFSWQADGAILSGTHTRSCFLADSESCQLRTAAHVEDVFGPASGHHPRSWVASSSIISQPVQFLGRLKVDSPRGFRA
ncbi:hypothetical protein CPLU01_11429 [Colletotrichum plurivorum]|uniref:Uncharacterized protein n=1 Tax=Colletotrichum plurivorum TaxID=2175906 RepID=A0A8H6K217_9PEZI|nr:hypothetical protein CPLU01_11429 [Colletotrichum plurivorum]